MAKPVTGKAALTKWVKTFRPSLANTIGSVAGGGGASLHARLERQYRGLHAEIPVHVQGRLVCLIAATLCERPATESIRETASQVLVRSDRFRDEDKVLALVAMALLVRHGGDGAPIVIEADRLARSSQLDGVTRVTGILCRAIAGGPSTRGETYAKANKVFSSSQADEGERMLALVAMATVATPTQARSVMDEAQHVVDSSRGIFSRYGRNEVLTAFGALVLAASTARESDYVTATLPTIEGLHRLRKPGKYAAGFRKDGELAASLALAVLTARSRAA